MHLHPSFKHAARRFVMHTVAGGVMTLTATLPVAQAQNVGPPWRWWSRRCAMRRVGWAASRYPQAAGTGRVLSWRPVNPGS
jgi:hypothetical protein